MKLLSRPEELILLSVWKLQSDAYGIRIRKHLKATTGRSWSIGSVYVPLDKLTTHGFLVASQAPPTEERGGRRKRCFRLTRKGLSALNEVRTIHEKMWSNLPEPVPVT